MLVLTPGSTTDPTAALARGLALFPIPAGRKVPAERAWHERCTADPAVFKAAWEPGENFGVGCRASNLFVIDLDGRVGIDAFAAVCERAGRPQPSTFTVVTPHAGRHLYFRPPPGMVLFSTSGGVSGLGPKIDTRGPGERLGGYVVGPGSVVDGLRYSILDVTAPIATLPDWLAAIVDAAAQALRRRAAARPGRGPNA